MTKTAAIPIYMYGRIPLKILNPRTEELVQEYLVYSIKDSSPS